jgi:hypothetical protein
MLVGNRPTVAETKKLPPDVSLWTISFRYGQQFQPSQKSNIYTCICVINATKKSGGKEANVRRIFRQKNSLF